jgi:hypothetical protein
MTRHKKEKPLQVKEKIEEPMTEQIILDNVETEIDVARAELEKLKVELEEKKLELKRPMRELDDHELVLVKKQAVVSNAKSALKEKIEAQKKRDNEMVTGKFINRKSPGQSAKLTYLKYDDDPVKWYTLEDGKTYTIPRGFMDQLNGGDETNPCYYTPHFTQKTEIMDPNRPSSAIHDIDASQKKYAFFETRAA